MNSNILTISRNSVSQAKFIERKDLASTTLNAHTPPREAVPLMSDKILRELIKGQVLIWQAE